MNTAQNALTMTPDYQLNSLDLNSLDYHVWGAMRDDFIDERVESKTKTLRWAESDSEGDQENVSDEEKTQICFHKSTRQTFWTFY